MTPTHSELTAFLQGYQQCQKDAITAANDARRLRRNVTDHIAERLRTGYATWKLRAEQKGYRDMPAIDQVVACCVLAVAILAMMAVAFR